MKKTLFLTLIILAACNQDEISPELDFVGKYELTEFHIYDETGEDLLDYFLIDPNATAELELFRDGTYKINLSGQYLVLFAQTFGVDKRDPTRAIGIWEVSDYAYSFHFDRGVLEYRVDYDFTDEGLVFYPDFSRVAYSDYKNFAYNLGFESGLYMAQLANNNSTFEDGSMAGLYYGYYSGYYDTTPVDEFFDSNDLIYQYTWGFLGGFDADFKGLAASTVDFKNGFNGTVDVYYDFGSEDAVYKSNSLNEFYYDAEYYFRKIE